MKGRVTGIVRVDGRVVVDVVDVHPVVVEKAGTFKVGSVDSYWEQQVFEFLASRQPTRPDGTYELTVTTDPVFESDPSLRRARSPREFVRQVRDIMGYEYRKATGQLRVVEPETRWRLDGVKLFAL